MLRRNEGVKEVETGEKYTKIQQYVCAKAATMLDYAHACSLAKHAQ